MPPGLVSMNFHDQPFPSLWSFSANTPCVYSGTWTRNAPQSGALSSQQPTEHCLGPGSFRSFCKNATVLCDMAGYCARACVLGLARCCRRGRFEEVCECVFSSPCIIQAAHDKHDLLPLLDVYEDFLSCLD